MQDRDFFLPTAQLGSLEKRSCPMALLCLRHAKIPGKESVLILPSAVWYLTCFYGWKQLSAYEYGFRKIWNVVMKPWTSLCCCTGNWVIRANGFYSMFPVLLFSKSIVVVCLLVSSLLRILLALLSKTGKIYHPSSLRSVFILFSMKMILQIVTKAERNICFHTVLHV
jgi:hypothetical protein